MLTSAVVLYLESIVVSWKLDFTVMNLWYFNNSCFCSLLSLGEKMLDALNIKNRIDEILYTDL